jgi:hypothetical protein
MCRTGCKSDSLLVDLAYRMFVARSPERSRKFKHSKVFGTQNAAGKQRPGFGTLLAKGLDGKEEPLEDRVILLKQQTQIA